MPPSSQSNSRWTLLAERALFGVLLAWLLWVPLPFGSVVEASRGVLIAVPLALCALAAALRLWTTRERTTGPDVTRAWRIWSVGAVLLIVAGLLQLVPLPRGLLGALSPESRTIWETTVAQVPEARPVTIDPSATAFELFRLAALFASFQTAALLARGGSRRIVLASVLTVSALFQMFYGVREAALGRYAIWGWENKLIFNRVTGTFVNPNHYAHYIGIIVPMTLFLGAVIYRNAAPPKVPFRQRVVQLFERSLVPFGLTLLAAVACLAAVLLSQSRGGLLAIAAGLLFAGAMLPGKRLLKLALAGAAGVVLIAALVLILGRERTLERYEQASTETSFGGRRIAIAAALNIWSRFSIMGSGLGTFDRVVSTAQTDDHGHRYHHAHNDYAELGATAGTLGFTIGIVALFGGYVALVRQTFGPRAGDLSWKRRAFQVAALASLTIAMVHALYDFNFYIPANPVTLAAILGAAVTVTDHDRRTRR